MLIGATSTRLKWTHAGLDGRIDYPGKTSRQGLRGKMVNIGEKAVIGRIEVNISDHI